MAIGRRQRRAAEDRHRRSIRAWSAGSWLLIALFVGTTLLGAGALVLTDGLATTCSDYVSKVPGAPFDFEAGFHRCHHFLGLEIPTQWNPALAIGFGFAAAGVQSLIENRTPPPAPKAG
jgi:hypothetical protein